MTVTRPLALPTVTWDGTLTAVSSIAHTGEVRGVTSMLRRELIVQPDGEILPIPVISGNSWRGSLRRIGETLLRDTVHYDGLLPLSALHALRGGGALAKVAGEPLSGARLATLRDLVPQIGVFGTAAGGRIIDGALMVGKLLPFVAETNHITGADITTSSFAATQLETYIRTDDTHTHAATTVIGADDTADGLNNDTGDGAADPTNAYLNYRIETFPAGTRFSTWVQLNRPTPLELAFFCEVLAQFAAGGRLGGRRGTGHGVIRADLTATPPLPGDLPDWRAVTRQRRDDVLNALTWLT